MIPISRKKVGRSLEYARYAYFVGAPEGTGLSIFEIAEQLLQEEAVELCHPELIYPRRSRQTFPQQWHLKPTSVNGQTIDASANIEAAWELSTGEEVTIAVIDDGVDIDHEEFRTAGKVISLRDVSRRVDNPRPLDGDNHGTACAGVACANGQFGASGVAPNAKLIPTSAIQFEDYRVPSISVQGWYEGSGLEHPSFPGKVSISTQD